MDVAIGGACPTTFVRDNYASFGVVGFDIFYFLYGLYEGQKYKQCTSCQVGNFIGTVAISFAKLTIIMLLSYYFM